MSINSYFRRGALCRSGGSRGFALILTLLAVVLISAVVIAFLISVLDQQASSSSQAGGTLAKTLSEGATSAIIANLQQEMYAGSGATGSVAILSMTNNATINPIRSVRVAGIDGSSLPSVPATYPGGNTPNDPYFQYCALVKQSIGQTPIYAIPGGATGPIIASNIPTTTAAVDNRYHDGTFWRLPQLLSVGTGSAPSPTADPAVPDWIYTTRLGQNPVTATGSPDQSTVNGSPNPAYITGRYAYNIYDIGGLLNANVVGNALTPNVSPQTAAPTVSANTTATLIVPGYKGSLITADLNGLTLSGNLQYTGTAPSTSTNSPSWQDLPKWRAEGAWPTNPGTFQGFGYLLTGGEYNGWLQDFFQAFDPMTAALNTSSSPLADYRFTSRQDLIKWVNFYWPNSTWVLPYLTHFSYDTDAPSFSPDPNRPKVQAGDLGNDASGLDDQVNPALTPTTAVPAPPVDSAGNPLIKRRFPLSALALIANYNGANPPPSSIQAQVQYDFGLTWNSNLTDPYTGESSPGWVYQQDNAGKIDRLSQITTRSPDFFETLKAAIATGSLGQQYGSTALNVPPPTGGVGGFGYLGGRDSLTNNQIIQIGANIISQVSTNYSSCHIRFNGTDFYGDQDFPGFYKCKLYSFPLDQFTGTAMQAQVSGQPQNSILEAVGVIPEIWNMHAPNAIGSATAASYPTKFRIVPSSATGIYANCAWGFAPWTMAIITDNYLDNYTAAGGFDCSHPILYSGVSNAYTLQSEVPSATPSTLNSFREPCPIISPDLPPHTTATGGTSTNISNWGGPQPALTLDLTNTSNVPGASAGMMIPTTFSAPSSTKSFAVVVGYIHAGPKAVNFANWLTVQQAYTTSLALLLQYSPNGGANYYTYDVLDFCCPSVPQFDFSNGAMNGLWMYRADPRTGRWGLIGVDKACPNTDYTVEGDAGGYAGNGLQFAGQTVAPGNNPMSSETLVQAWNSPSSGNWKGVWTTPFPMPYLQINQSSDVTSQQELGSATAATGDYYTDADGVVRLGDGAYTNANTSSTGSGTFGLPLMMLHTPLGSGNSGSTVVGNTTDYTNRPVILDRPFQSVGELGYVFRDVPFRTLDFFTPQSGDSALLDYFCAYGPDPYSYQSTFTTESGLVAGRVNLNSAPPGVLASLLEGSSVTTPTQAPGSLVPISASVATSIGEALNTWTHSSSATMGPLRNRAELVGKYVSGSGTSAVYSGFSFGDPSTPANQLTNLLKPLGTEATVIKQQRECVVRALADVGTTRTWNLLIDLVAQSGHLIPGATTLDQFAVSGERHVWVSVAIDRMTGKVIRIETEPVRL